MSPGIGVGTALPFVHLQRRSSELSRLAKQFEGPGDPVSASYYSLYADNQSWTLRQHVGDGLYFTTQFTTFNGISVGDPALKIERVLLQEQWRCVNDQTTPAVAESGILGKSDATSAFGGRNISSSSAGSYLEATFGECTSLGLLSYTNSTGLAKVEIDGDATLADLLPTAQELVTSGDFASTILVANGGTLNPTDRVWYGKGNTANVARIGEPTKMFSYLEVFTRSLSEGEHTVRVTFTGYQNAVSDSAAAYCHCLVARGPSISADSSGDTLNMYLTTEAIATTIRPVWDLSYNTTPTGASGAEWMGHSGSEVINVAPKLQVDGVDATLSVDEEAFGATSVAIIMTNGLRHSEIDSGSTDIGVIVYAYAMEPTTGLTITHTITWASAGTTVGYPGMMSVDAAQFDKYQILGSGAAAVALAGNTGSNFLATDSQAAYCWKAGERYAMLFHVPNLADVDDYDDGTMFWYDFNGNWKKVYAQRFSSPYAYASEEVFVNTGINWRLAWFSGDADNVLS